MIAKTAALGKLTVVSEDGFVETDGEKGFVFHVKSIDNVGTDVKTIVGTN